LGQLTASSETDPNELRDMMMNNNIDYVFLGRRGGSLSHTALMQSGLFDQIYNENGVWILKVRPTP
jgi:hypothetical protein